MKFKSPILITALAWLLIVAASLFWNWQDSVNEQKRIALESAKSFYDYVVLARRWNSNHQGVYVPVTETTPSNPYLEIPFRDLEIENLRLTRMNPSYMTRQISELAMETDGVLMHLTSLDPIRPGNKANTLETEALKKFENGINEVGVFLKQDSKTSFFYMAPLITEKSCLQCHAKQGYEEGDVRGGISITLPFVMEIPFVPLLTSHLSLGFIGLFSIFYFGRKLNESYETVKGQAVMDALTGIPNRRSFSEKIIHELKRSQRTKSPLAAIMCDLDHFKSYNDSNGHVEGDTCLQKVAAGLTKALKRPGDFCARYGGEEFVILLPDTSLEGALVIAERIRVAIESLRISHKQSLPWGIVTLSLGVSALEENAGENSQMSLIEEADAALYKAKKEGRNRVVAFNN
jgi:diguanylate cyclase (GGDEF)-like protein